MKFRNLLWRCQNGASGYIYFWSLNNFDVENKQQIYNLTICLKFNRWLWVEEDPVLTYNSMWNNQCILVICHNVIMAISLWNDLPLRLKVRVQLKSVSYSIVTVYNYSVDVEK